MSDLIFNYNSHNQAANETPCYNACQTSAISDVVIARSSSNGSKMMASDVTDDGNNNFDVIYFHLTVPLLFCSVTVLGVTGNLLVIYVIARKQVSHTVTNLLLLNLAVADLAFVAICPPFTAYR